MITLTVKQKIGLGLLIGIVLMCGAVLFALRSPLSPFSGLHNDLKTIEPPVEQSYTDLDGNPVKLSDFRGKPLIINSWATWMPFSKEELEALSTLKESKGDALTILAINRMEDKAVIRAYLATYSIDDSKIIFLVDPADTFYKGVGGYAMPETVFYATDGVITVHTRGVLAPEDLKISAEALLD
ncbi:TlpA family protein disulfide reductase [Candidatus Kaiserbacteria bacterium]|nr:MAG: TlpA family protein disulfide reductase [Candidatus Kaiserbacteria bacterium]